MASQQELRPAVLEGRSSTLQTMMERLTMLRPFPEHRQPTASLLRSRRQLLPTERWSVHTQRGAAAARGV
jgi:hypothetical protein